MFVVLLLVCVFRFFCLLGFGVVVCVSFLGCGWVWFALVVLVCGLLIFSFLLRLVWFLWVGWGFVCFLVFFLFFWFFLVFGLLCLILLWFWFWFAFVFVGFLFFLVVVL